MTSRLITTLLQSRTQRRLRSIAQRAQTHTQACSALSDEALRDQVHALGAPTKSTMPRSLALVQEAAWRALGLRPYDVQAMAAAALFDGVIAQMKTGEGKTLAIALAAAMAALTREGVHVAVPNAYLASRDAQSMAPLYNLLGLTVGLSMPGLDAAQKQTAYLADITYAVHSELGFDYLRDHTVAKPDQRVQRGLHFAIVDEADSILIDEARTPLVISMPSEDDSQLVRTFDIAVRPLQRGAEVAVDEAQQNATLTEQGMDRIGAWLCAQRVVPTVQALYEPAHLHLQRYLSAALRAHFVFARDRDYLVRDGEVHIIDPATGRVLHGRRWQRGLHQAVEAKERVRVQPEAVNAAQITYQNFFGLYGQLAGLTGTALTSQEEFETVYQRPVIAIPTHRPMIRQDHPDLLFTDQAAKFLAIVDDVVAQREAGRPVLIGASSVAESEAVSAWLSWAGIPHRLLNARQHVEEAQIIAEAGLPGAITVATSMAGRGTDILLGGSTLDDTHAQRRAQVVAAGGLHIIGTQRQDSHRTDDQLRGRAGRQGDPGSSRFYLSLQDDLLRVHGANHMATLSALTWRVEGEGVHSATIDKAVARAQQKLESVAFGARNDLAQTDGVTSKQRAAVYALRNDVLDNRLDLHYLESLIAGAVGRLVDTYIDATAPVEKWELLTLKATVSEAYAVELPLMRWAMVEHRSAAFIRANVIRSVLETYRAVRFGQRLDRLNEHERLAVLAALDQAWRAQLEELDAIREGISLRSYANQNPAHAFAQEARDAFVAFQAAFEDMSVSYLWRLLRAQGDELSQTTRRSARAIPPLTRRLVRCPCGSGRRFKHCHGNLNA